MDSLSIIFSSSPPLQDHHPKTHRPNFTTSKPLHFLKTSLHNHHSHKTLNPTPPKSPPIPFQDHLPVLKKFQVSPVSLKSHINFTLLGLSTPLSCLASEATVAPEQASDKISVESVLISIDDFFSRNPFFVAGVTFIWLIAIPLTKAYLRKYKKISAIDAFRKLRDDPSAQLLDIRDRKSMVYLCSPNLKIVNKAAAQVHYKDDDDDEGFVKKVLENFADPVNTTVCVLDNFDSNSMKVAELLSKNGFKQTYAIKGGVRGKKGWQEIQETLLPPSAHVYRKKKVKKSQKLQINGETNQQIEVDNEPISSTSALVSESEKVVHEIISEP